METLWKQILDELQLEVSTATFFTFFKKTELLSLENNVATIHAPTYMVAGELEKRYGSLIKNALEKKKGGNISVVFTSLAKDTKAKQVSVDAGPLFTPTTVKRRPLRIKEAYQFNSIAVSDSNQIAYTAAQTVSEHLGKKYNPLFIYGSVGVGKTHLMHAIANKVLETKPDAKILYLTTEEFTNEVVEAIRDRSTQNLRRKFRHTDLLLLDDIQFLAGKEKVQEELFHTFNALIDNGGQIVFTSDRPPAEIKKIESRLASRFAGGLTVDIEQPDFELRTAILLIKSAEMKIPISTEVAKTIAEKVEDTRALEGFLLKVSSFQLTKKGEQITIEETIKLLGSASEKKRMLHPDTVVDVVCNFYNIKPTQLRGSKRDSIFVKPRHMCMFLLKEDVKLTLLEIGNMLGGRDHTTVMHGVEKIGSLLKNHEERVVSEISFLRNKLSQEGLNN